MSEIEPSVSAFFESYRAAFERMDAPTVAEHFAYPCHVTSDAGEIALVPVAARADWVRNIERLLDMYRAVGVSSARALGLSATRLSPRLVQAVVRWGLYDAAARPLYEFDAAYTLADAGGGPRITAIAHNEVPRYRECLARLTAERGRGG